MARFVALKPQAAFRCLAAAGTFAAALGDSAFAQQAMPMAPTPPPAQAPAVAHAPNVAPTTNAAPILPPDTMAQYGKIVQPGDQPAHPLKLKLPLPDVGEVKIPSPDELTMRDKLEQLAMLSDADIRSKLEKWPAYGKMSLRDQGAMLIRMQDFRDFRSNVARNKAHEMGLLTLTPDQQAKFEKDYWDSRLKLDHDLAKQFTPIFKAAEQKMRDDLYRKYSVVSQGPVAQVPKPPMGTPAPTNAAMSTAASAPVYTAPTNNAVIPLGQAR